MADPKDPVNQPGSPPAESTPPQEPTPPAEPEFVPDKEGKIVIDEKVFLGFKNDMHKFKDKSREQEKTIQDLADKVKADEDAKKEATDKKLLEDGEFKELAEKKEAEIKDLKLKNQNILIDSSIKVKALELGANNVDDVIKLFDKDQIKVNESGQIEDFSEAMKDFKELKPYLFGTVDSPDGTPKVNTNKAIKVPVNLTFRELLADSKLAAKVKTETPELYEKLKKEHNGR